MDLASVAVALVMLVDVSGSIDNREYDLQRSGIVAAFEDRAVQRAIWQQRAIAVTVIEWSDTQRTVVPWRVLSDADGAVRFAAEVALVKRSSSGRHPSRRGDHRRAQRARRLRLRARAPGSRRFRRRPQQRRQGHRRRRPREGRSRRRR